MRFRDYLFIGVILVLAGLLTWREFGDNTIIRTIQKTDTILVRDTLRLWLPARVHYKKIYIERYDTIRERFYTEVTEDTTTWFACADTTVGKTAVNVCFFYPRKYFGMQISYQPDTVEKMIIVEKPLVRLEQPQNRWYYDVAKIGGGLILGYILGRVK